MKGLIVGEAKELCNDILDCLRVVAFSEEVGGCFRNTKA
jgi:hypothetical protein